MAIFFLMMGSVFAWLLYQAITTGEILAQGWGFSTRKYSRDDQPVWYWVTFASYVVCVAISVAIFSGR